MINKQIRHLFDDAIQRKLKYIDIPPIYCRQSGKDVRYFQGGKPIELNQRSTPIHLMQQINEVIHEILSEDVHIQNIHHLGKGLYFIEYAKGD